MLIQKQKGFIPIVLIAGILIALAALGGGFAVLRSTAVDSGTDNQNETRSNSVVSLDLSEKNSSGSTRTESEIEAKTPVEKPLSAFDRVLQRINLKPRATPTTSPVSKTSTSGSTSPTSSPASALATSTPTQTPTATPTSNSTSNPTTTPTTSPTTTTSFSGYALCEVHTSPTTGSAPLSVQLIYGMAVYGNVGTNPYVREVQWDWDGDGNWDTNYSINNQQLTHTYQSPGTYPLRLHLKLSTGYETQVCTGSITIN